MVVEQERTLGRGRRVKDGEKLEKVLFIFFLCFIEFPQVTLVYTKVAILFVFIPDFSFPAYAVCSKGGRREGVKEGGM